MKIPTYQEFLTENMLKDEDAAKIWYKELLAKIIRVSLDNMMANVHQHQKECTVEQMYSIAAMFHALNSFFVIPKEK